MEPNSVQEGVVTVRILFLVIPIIIGIIHCIWRRNDPSFSKIECFFTYFLTIGVGLQSLIVGHLEIYHGDIVATFIGWPNTPFLSELGKANISFGLLGILSFWFKGGWRSATAVGAGLFIMMASIGHYRYFIYEDHSHTENIGPLVVTNMILASCLFILLILRRLTKS
jgi:hypothetical protein